MLCTAEMTYAHARLCIAIHFKIEYWPLPKLAKGIRELYMIVRVSSIVCFTILVLPVLLDEEYWSFQYRVFYNTSITSIVG
jgi:hypothetical protein